MEKEIGDLFYRLIEIEQVWITEDNGTHLKPATMLEREVDIFFYEVREMGVIDGGFEEAFDIVKEGTWFKGVFLEDWNDLETEYDMGMFRSNEFMHWDFISQDEAEKMFNEKIEELKRMEDKKD